MFVDKGDEKLCEECGEVLTVVRDYGVAGEARECKICGFYVEEVDLRETTLTDP